MSTRNLKDASTPGGPQERIEGEFMDSRFIFQQLPESCVEIDNLTQQLEDEGIDKFNKSFDGLLNTLEIATTKSTHPLSFSVRR